MNPTTKAFEDAKRSILSNVTSSEDRLSVMKIPIEGETKEVTATFFYLLLVSFFFQLLAPQFEYLF